MNPEARYGMVVFAKSPDKKYVDFLIVIYNASFKLKGRMSDVTERERLQNFFRYKAMKQFKTEGFID